MYLAESGIGEWIQGGAAGTVAIALIVALKVFVSYIRHRDELEVQHAEIEQKAAADKDAAFRAMLANDLAHHHQKCHGALDRVCSVLTAVERRLAALNDK